MTTKDEEAKGRSEALSKLTSTGVLSPHPSWQDAEYLASLTSRLASGMSTLSHDEYLAALAASRERNSRKER